VDGSTSIQASKPEHTNPRESGPPNNEQATAKWQRYKSRMLEHRYNEYEQEYHKTGNPG